MQDAFGVDRGEVSKGALKTILFGAQKVKKPPKPQTISRLTGQPIVFDPKVPTAPQRVFRGRNPFTGQTAPQRNAGYQAKRRAKLSRNTPMLPRQPAQPNAQPKKWYQKRTNQAMMAGGAAAFGTAGYMGYKKGKREQ